MFEIEAAEEDWDAALATLDREVSAKVISRDKARRRRAVLLTAKAMTATEAARGQLRGAKAALEKPSRWRSTPLRSNRLLRRRSALAARLCSETGRARKVIRLIEAAWDVEPHPDLADVWLDMTEGESGYDRAVRARPRGAQSRSHRKPYSGCARRHRRARLTAAREALAVYAGPDASAMPTQRICELMAEIEEGAFGDRGAARGWLARALHAPQDPQWTGENYRSPRWSPIDPMTGAFDALVWTAPAIALAREEPRPDASGQDAEQQVERTEAPAAPVVSLTERAAPKEPLAFQPPLPDDPGPEDADEVQEGERKW